MPPTRMKGTVTDKEIAYELRRDVRGGTLIVSLYNAIFRIEMLYERRG